MLAFSLWGAMGCERFVNGRFQLSWFTRTDIVTKIWLIKYSLILLSLVALIGFPQRAYFLGIEHYNNDSFEAKLSMPESDNSIKEWVDKLVMAESGGDPNAIFEVDLNGKPSKGCLQFQLGTWTSYGDSLGLDTTLENIYDCELQKELTYRMIEHDPRNWKHWECSVQGMNSEFCKKYFESIGVNKVGIGLPPNFTNGTM